jgi:hypothetical protein
MTRVPFTTLQATANPKINTDPRRYTTADQVGNDPPLPQEMNLIVDQTLNFLNFVTVDDAKLEVFNHDSNSNGPDALGTDFSGVTVAPVTAETPYVFTADPTIFELVELAGRFDVQQYTGQALSSDVDQIHFQIAAKTRAIRSLFGRLFILGSTATAGQFDGLAALGVQTVGGLTAPLDDFDDALAALKTNDRPADDLVIMMNSRAYRKVLSLQRAAGGDEAISFRYCEELGFNCLHYAGVPVCINEHIPTTTEQTNIYFFDRNIVVGVVNENHPDIQVTTVQHPAAAAMSYVVSWHVCIALLSDLGLVTLENFNVAIT